MSDTDEKNTLPVPEPAGAAERMRERLLAFHCGALEEDEAALIRGRLESDPDWQRGSAGAQKMLGGLTSDGVRQDSVPAGLGERAMLRLKESAPPKVVASQGKMSRDELRVEKLNEPARAPFFSARMAAALAG